MENAMQLTSRNINRKLKKMGYDLELWYDRAGGTWVITGTDINGDWFSRSVYLFRLNMMTFDQWIETALHYYNASG
jgi:hypothetical protein